MENKPEIKINIDAPLIKVVEPLINIHLRKELSEGRERTGWHASDLGKCPSGVYYSRLSPEKEIIDDRLMRVFSVGHAFHDWIQSKMKDAGVLLGMEDELKVKDEKRNASGRADMVIKANGQNILYDIKTVHSQKFWYLSHTNFKADEHYVQQIHFYYEGLKDKFKDLIMVLLYVSKDDLAFQEVYVPYDPKVTEKNNKFLDVLEKAWKEKKAPEPEPTILFDEQKEIYMVNWKAKYCDYHHLCTGSDSWLSEAEMEAKSLTHKRKIEDNISSAEQEELVI
jgi:hypothetical protein